MAITWAASLPAVGANNGGDVTLTLSNLVNAAGGAYTLVENDVVVIAYASSGTADQAMAMVTAGYTSLGEHYSGAASIDTNIAVFAKKMGATPDTTAVVDGPTGASNGTIAVAHVLKGADITALDTAAITAAGTGTTIPNPGSVTPVTAGAFIAVVGAGAAAAGATFTPNADLNTTTNHWRTGNHAETNDIAIGFGWNEDWTSGAFDPGVWTGGNVNAANSWAALTLAIKPSVAASLTADAGSYALTGTAATLSKGFKVTADAGAFALTGTAATLRRTHILSAAAGSYALTGTAAGLAKGLRLVADAGSYALTGTAANLLRSLKIVANVGSYALTGTAATLRRAVGLTAAAGSYAYTGVAATLTEAGGAQNYTLVAAPGSYALTGTDASLWAPVGATPATWTPTAATSVTWNGLSPDSATWTPVPPTPATWT